MIFSFVACIPLFIMVVSCVHEFSNTCTRQLHTCTVDTCLNVDMKSNSRLAPCEQCATGSYTSDESTCAACGINQSTDGPGAGSESDCKGKYTSNRVFCSAQSFSIFCHD